MVNFMGLARTAVFECIQKLSLEDKFSGAWFNFCTVNTQATVQVFRQWIARELYENYTVT